MLFPSGQDHGKSFKKILLNGDRLAPRDQDAVGAEADAGLLVRPQK
jgi:hypothetical protein